MIKLSNIDFSSWANLDGRWLDFQGWGKHAEHYKDLNLNPNEVKPIWMTEEQYLNNQAQNEGWRRIVYLDGELSLGDKQDKEIPILLNIVKKNRPDWSFPKIILMDGHDAIRLEDGEDIMDAWNNRKSIRKRIMSSIKLSQRDNSKEYELNITTEYDDKNNLWWWIVSESSKKLQNCPRKPRALARG